MPAIKIKSLLLALGAITAPGAFSAPAATFGWENPPFEPHLCYTMHSDGAPNKVLTATGEGVGMQDPAGTPNQVWQFVPTDPSAPEAYRRYRIRSWGNGDRPVVDVVNDGGDHRALHMIQLGPWSGQTWKYETSVDSDGRRSYRLYNGWTGSWGDRCFGLDNGSLVAWLGDCQNGGLDQYWTFEIVVCPSFVWKG